ncbi:nucleotidyltransferase family protein [soil metagenome]
MNMSKDAVLACLRQHHHEFDEFHIKSLSIFGSVARNEAKANSDVDILVDFEKPLGLFKFIRLQKQLEALLNHKVDLVSRNALKPQLRERILSEKADV